MDKLNAQLGGVLEGGKAAVRKIDECLEMGISFTQETTLSGARTERTIRRAKDLGYNIRLYYIGLDTVEESLGRIRNRVAKGGHNIPREDVERRFSTRFADVLRVLPYCDEARFFDNDNGFVAVSYTHLIFCIVNMKMRLAVLPVIGIDHFNDDVVKPA